MDRDQYQIAVLFQPGKPWTRGRAPAAVQPQAADHPRRLAAASTTSRAPRRRRPATPRATRARPRLRDDVDRARQQRPQLQPRHCRPSRWSWPRSTSSKSYGTLRYTIGTGCSGGSLAQQWIANAYPGVYQGILPTCSFPDAWGTATQFVDYHLLLAYFKTRRSGALGVAWTPDADGGRPGAPDGVRTPRSPTTPSSTSRSPPTTCAGTTAAAALQPEHEPGRRSLHDRRRSDQRLRAASRSRCGQPTRRSSDTASRGLPIDNVGVQYGLGRAEGGQITPAEFVDLNAKVGGLDIDANPTAARAYGATSPRWPTPTAAGMINEANNLDQDGDHRLPRPRPGCLPRRLPRVRRPRSTGPRARDPRQPADLGGPGRDHRRRPLRGEQLPRDGWLARGDRAGHRRRAGRAEDRRTTSPPT